MNWVICFLITKYKVQVFVLIHLLYNIVFFFLYYTHSLFFLISEKCMFLIYIQLSDNKMNILLVYF